jgi:D-3-phosphoglycerate dehydrogenase / 2-oxoglutarate reductase
LKIKVVYTSVPPIDLDTASMKKLGVEYLEIPSPTEDDLISNAFDADVLIDRSEPCTRRVISSLKSCRLIMTPKVGYDNIDVNAATEFGICVANIPGLSVDEVSDHTMALLLSCSRKIIKLNNMVRGGDWHVFHGKEMQFMWNGISQLRGQVFGLVGLGAISRAIVPKAQAFGLKVISYDPYVTPDVMSAIGVESVSLERLLVESDFVSVHTPLTPNTRHLIGTEQFRLMKKTAYFINASRGAVVDENALYRTLADDRIAGAGLDVLEKEPVDMNNPLLKLDNVILTGHSAHYSDQAWHQQSHIPVEEVRRIMSGEWPLGLVNPQVKTNYLARWCNNK